MDVYGFEDFLYLGVNDLPKENLSNTVFASALISGLQKLLLGDSKEKIASQVYVHRTSPGLSFVLGEVYSPSMGIRLCIVPPNQELRLYVFCAREMGVKSRREEIRNMVQECYVPRNSTTFVMEREL